MKRLLALLAALCLFAGVADAEGSPESRTPELTRDGLTVIRCQLSGQTDTLTSKLDYPAFESDDTALAEYLTQTVTEPLLALRRAEPMSDAAAYTADTKDYVRMSFFASMDFGGLLSVEASVYNRSADQAVNEVTFFYRIIDLGARRELTVYDLFTEPQETVTAAIRSAVFSIKDDQGEAIVDDAAQVPAPNSYYLTTAAFRCLYAAGTVAQKATVVDVPWDKLGLTQSPLLLGEGQTTPEATAEAVVQMEETGSPTGGLGAGDALAGDALLARLTANDWQTEGAMLRFLPDGSITDPTGGAPLFVAYTLGEKSLFLTSDDRPDQELYVSETADGLLFTFEPETSDYTTLGLTPGAALPGEAAPNTPAPAEPTAAVSTPTPMPLTGDDADVLAFLTQGLWKRLGTDGQTYYQFMPDGKLLTIQVTPYSLAEGQLESGELAGTVEVGGNAFTLVEADGGQVGFVLNRSATPVPGEAFVTATPTPPPTPTPEPTPSPSPSPTPTASPAPTPTLSPYEQAAATAPTLAALGDATFAKRQSFKVYSAPDDQSYRDSKAQVTTDESVQIFGVTGEWVLVSYPIGNGSRGRIGYISNTTLADADNVAQLAFANIPLSLTKKANATDDPLNGKGKLFEIKKDAQVTLLAFLGTDWAYVETTYKTKPCRVFIPRASLMAE